MSLSFPLLTVASVAVGAVAPYRALKAGAVDGAVVQASTAADKFVGLSSHVGGTDESVDRIVSGIAPVEYGGNVDYGDFLTSDGQGRAVVAAAGERYFGVAQEGGDLDTIGSCLIQHGVVPA